MSLKASIDIGSNSILLLIMNVETKEVIEEISTITSLGRDLDKTGVFHDESMKDSMNCLLEYKSCCNKHSVSHKDIIVTATEASRVAANAKDFFTEVKNNTDLEVIIISGEAEAFYTALGVAKMSQLDGEFVIMDMGGASTELIHVIKEPFEILSSVSLPVGSVRTTDWIKENIVIKKYNEIQNSFNLDAFLNKNIVAVAGTMTALACIFNNLKSFDASIVNDYTITPVDIYKKLSSLQEEDVSQIGLDYPYLGKRVTSIKGGAYCAYNVLKMITPKKIMFSSFGLRYGTLLSGGIDENFRLERL